MKENPAVVQEDIMLKQGEKEKGVTSNSLSHPQSGDTKVSRRKVIIGGAATLALMNLPPAARASQLKPANASGVFSGRLGGSPADTMVANDGTHIHFKDWGSGQPIVFSHGWPLNADAWDAQMLFLAQHGYRVIAHDRRGHGRSGQSLGGNDLNTYADDLAQLLDVLNLKDVMLVGHSTGGGEVVRYVGRHGNQHLSKLVLIASITPTLLKSDKNPKGIPLSAFNDVRTSVAANRSQFLKDLSLPFFGYNKPGAKVSEGVRDEFWRQGMQASILGTYDCIKAQSETDMTEDLKKIAVPTLVLHGEEDQLVPIADTSMLTAKIIRNARLKIYPGAPHGMTVTFANEVNQDLLAFRRS
jgi:non-heme chloroperoxidase